MKGRTEIWKDKIKSAGLSVLLRGRGSQAHLAVSSPGVTLRGQYQGKQGEMVPSAGRIHSLHCH